MQKRLWIVAASAIAAVGCKPEVTANDVNTRTSAIVQTAVVSSTSAIDTLSSQTTMTALSGAFTKLDALLASMPALVPGSLAGTGSTTGSTTGTALAAKPVSGLAAALTGSCTPGMVDPRCQSAQSPDDVAAAVDEFLRTSVFTDENLESSDDTSATFLLAGEPFCESTLCTTTCTDTGCTQENCVTEVSPECVKMFADLQVRVKATLIGDDGVELALLIGADRSSPLVVDATSTSIGVTFDLGEAKAALIQLGAVTGQAVALPEVMTGRVRGELAINGEQDVSLSASVLEAIELVVTDAAGETGISLGAADPMLSLRVQGLTGALSAALSAGALDVYEPWSSATGDLMGTGQFELHVAGASGAVTLEQGATDLTVTDIGLGDGTTSIGKDGVPFFTVDLNPTQGRSLDATIAPDGQTDSAVFTVTPAFDLSLGFAYQPVAAAFPDIATWAYDETLRFALTGAAGESPAIVPVAADGLGFPGGIEVLAGTLTLSAASGARLDVPAGSCLVANASMATDAHPVIGAFAVATCP